MYGNIVFVNAVAVGEAKGDKPERLHWLCQCKQDRALASALPM